MYQNYALLPPVYECAGKTHELSRISDHAYTDGKLRVQQALTQDRPDTLRVRREWENISGECVHFRVCIEGESALCGRALSDSMRKLQWQPLG